MQRLNALSQFCERFVNRGLQRVLNGLKNLFLFEKSAELNNFYKAQSAFFEICLSDSKENRFGGLKEILRITTKKNDKLNSEENLQIRNLKEFSRILIDLRTILPDLDIFETEINIVKKIVSQFLDHLWLLRRQIQEVLSSEYLSNNSQSSSTTLLTLLEIIIYS